MNPDEKYLELSLQNCIDELRDLVTGKYPYVNERERTEELKFAIDEIMMKLKSSYMRTNPEIFGTLPPAPRGEAIAQKLAALIVEKMEKRAHKGDWKELDLEKCWLLLTCEFHELESELEWTSTPRDEKWKTKVRDEIADVAAYCAIMLDVLEKE